MSDFDLCQRLMIYGGKCNRTRAAHKLGGPWHEFEQEEVSPPLSQNSGYSVDFGGREIGAPSAVQPSPVEPTPQPVIEPVNQRIQEIRERLAKNVTDPWDSGNIDFNVNSPSDIEYLLSEVERMSQTIERLNAELKTLRGK